MYNTFKYNTNRYNQLAAGGLKYLEATMIGVGAMTTAIMGNFVMAVSMTGVGLFTVIPVAKFAGAVSMTGVGELSALISLKTDVPTVPYILEVRSSAGALIAILENASEIDYVQLLNAPHVLNFTLPTTDTKIANIILANELWLRDYQSNTVIRKFILQNTLDSRND